MEYIQKILLSILVTFLFTFTFNARAKQKVIYGNEDPYDLYQFENQEYQKMVDATLTQTPSNNITFFGDLVMIRSGTLNDQGICFDEKYSKQ